MSENEKGAKSEQDSSQPNDADSKVEEKEGGTGEETPRDGRGKQKEFFKEELRRLKTSLDKEKSKLKAPPKRDHMPYVYNTLAPYYNVDTAEFLIEMNEEAPNGFCIRNTATGLTDPWVDYHMDNFLLPKLESKAHVQPTPRDKDKKKSNDKDRPPKEGSTRLPKFPAVNVPTGDLARRNLYYSDVPMLREELRKKYSAEAQSKVDQDYTRTKQDFYRMELDKLQEVHPSSRSNMRSAYFAYLQNSPGSRKAVYECVRALNQNSNKQKKTEAATAK